MELSENKNLFQTIFDSASNGIAVMESVFDDTGSVKDFSILLFNAYTRNWIGDIDHKGKLYGDIFPIAKQNGILEKFIEVAETGVSTTFERWYEGDGMKHWFLFTAVKHEKLLVVTTEDITERKQSEIALQAALEEAERQRRVYHSITNNTPDLVYVFGLDYTFNYANKALLEMWGKPAEEAIGRGLRENGYEEWHAQMHEREIDEVAATKKSLRGTVSFPHAELGSRVYDYILVPVFNEAGEVEVVAGTTRDITESKRAQEKLQQSENSFRNMIAQTPAATLVLKGDDLVIEQINEHMLGLIGRGTEIIGKPLIKVLPELEGQYVWDRVQSVYKEGIPFDQSEVLVPHNRTGTIQEYYYNLSYRPLIEDGKITGMIQVAIDVTEQVQARRKVEESETRYKILSETLEQQVNDRTKELQRSNEALQQFAHVASHDLKEPVRKIKTFTARLEEHLEGKLDDTAKRYIERIDVATNRMFTMIDGVLSYSTINEGTHKAEPVNLNEVVKNIETDLEVALQKSHGKILYDDLPTLEGEPVLLYQLFYNLIKNSLKFGVAGKPPLISITSEVIDDNVAIKVKDNGIGFDPHYSEQIFETFIRLNPKDQYEGTGLGLSLCKKIVEQHGGKILADASPDNGATFTITLPLKQNENDF